MDRKPTTNLGLVIEINPTSISKHYPYDEIEYVDISSVDTGSFSGSTRMPLAEAPSRAKRLVEHGDTILATVRPNLRSFLFIKNPPENMVVSTGFAVLHPSNKIDARFLYYTVTDQKFTDYLTANAKGSAYPAVDTETVARAEISFPTLEIQQKIAGILSAYDDLIENNLRRIKILEEMAQTLYREWFVKFRFPGHQKVKMVDSPLGKIPEGWEVRPSSDVAEYINGYAFKPTHWGKEGVPIIKIRELKNGITPETPRFNGEIDYKFRVSNGELLFSWSADLDVYWWSGGNGWLNQHLFKVIPFQEEIKAYLFFSLREAMPTFRSMSLGTTMRHIKRSALGQVSVVIPPRHTTSLFSQNVIPQLDMVVNLRQRNDCLSQTRDLLLPKLISGELDVSELEITIPEANA